MKSTGMTGATLGLAIACATCAMAQGSRPGAPVAADAEVFYTLRDLNAVDSKGVVVGGYSINNWGEVGGIAWQLGGSYQGFVTGPKAQGVHLIDPYYYSSQIVQVGNSGDAAGTSCTQDSYCHVFAFGRKHPKNPVWIDIPNGISARAAGINAAGQVVGTSQDNGGNDTAFLTGPRASGLTTFDDYPQSSAIAINDPGQMLWAYYESPTEHFMLRDPDGTDHPLALSYGTAGGINASAQVVGSPAFITGPDGANPYYLGAIDGATQNGLVGINARGQAVGNEGGYFNGVYETRALVTDLRGTHLYQLETLVGNMPKGVHLSYAWAIDDQGRIVANGSNEHVYLLTPTRQHYPGFRMKAYGAAVAEVGGIGPRGDVAVTIENQDYDYLPAVYRQGSVKTLDTTGSAYAVNARGDVVGERSGRGALWPKSGGETDIVPPGNGSNVSLAMGINDTGFIIGYYVSGRTDFCYGWTASRGSFDLGLPPGASFCEARAVNNAGQVTGQTQDAQGNGVAFLWENGEFDLLASPAGLQDCSGLGLDSAGDVAGDCIDSSEVIHAVTWHGGAAIDLYPGVDVYGALAIGINDAGTIVGEVDGAGVIFDGQGGFTHISDLVRGEKNRRITDVAGINDRGQIAVNGYLLVPAP